MSDNVLFLIMSTFAFVVFVLLWLNKVFENYYRKRYRKSLKHQGFIDISQEDFSKTGVSKVAVKLSSDYSSIYGGYHLSWDELFFLLLSGSLKERCVLRLKVLYRRRVSSNV